MNWKLKYGRKNNYFKNMNIVFAFRVIHAFFALVILYFISQYLSPVQQGWYYTFLSFSALIYLFDFGLSTALVHISAIEFAKSKWGMNGAIIGGDTKRFEDFINIAFHKYIKLAFFYFFIIFPFGILYFNLSQSSQDIFWFIPWIIHIISAALSLICFPFINIIEGTGNIKEIYKLKIIQVSLGTILCCIFIYFNNPLIAVSMILLSLFLTTILWLLIYRKNNLTSVLKIKGKFNWKENVDPFKNKIGLTFLGSYLFTQIYTPILFYYEDPSLAGKFGLSLAIANMVGIISSSWITINIPKMTKAVAEKEFKFFKRLFMKSFLKSVVFLILSLITLIVFYLFFEKYEITNRLLDFYSFIGLLVIILIMHIINSIVIYLRCFKKEPLVIIHFVCSVVTLFIGILFIPHYSVNGLISIILIIQILIALPISIIRLKKFSY